MKSFGGSLFVAAILLITPYVYAASLPPPFDCPSLKPRDSPASSVHDLRPDDIAYVAAMGDSITAALAAVNIDTQYIDVSKQLYQERGYSWLMGGDDKAVSIASFIKNYSPKVQGASTGRRHEKTCPVTLFCADAAFHDETDHLNAATPGAYSFNISAQVDYLIERIGKGTPAEKEWKLINIYIGSNDLAISCLQPKSAQIYYLSIQAAIKKLKENVDYALVNLIGLLHIEQTYYVTDKLPGYRKTAPNGGEILHKSECLCCNKPGGVDIIAANVENYNGALQKIVHETNSPLLDLGVLKADRKDTFTLVFQPLDLDTTTLDPHALSNIDGYHPNLLGHAFYAKSLWNELFKASKPSKQIYSADLQPYCPTESDRFQTK